MANPSITGDTSIDLGSVQDEDVQIIRRIPNLNVALTSSSSTINVGLLGAKRLITISGRVKGTEAQLDTFVTSVEVWINQGTQGNRTYNDSLSNAYIVKAIDFTRTRNIEAPGKLDYTLVMIEGL